MTKYYLEHMRYEYYGPATTLDEVLVLSEHGVRPILADTGVLVGLWNLPEYLRVFNNCKMDFRIQTYNFSLHEIWKLRQYIVGSYEIIVPGVGIGWIRLGKNVELGTSKILGLRDKEVLLGILKDIYDSMTQNP